MFTYNNKDKRLIVDVSTYMANNILSIYNNDANTNKEVHVEDLEFLSKFRSEFCQLLHSILEDSHETTNELFIEIILSTNQIQNQYQLSMVNQCLKSVEEKVNVKLNYLQNKSYTNNELNTNLQYLCYKKINGIEFSEVRVAVVGNVDAGKSTLLGVLSRDFLDDGRGSARARVFRHLHEVVSGRTSSVGTVVVGFDNDGNVVKRLHQAQSNKDKSNYKDICINSAKVVVFVDLAGHEKYFKTTIFGLLGHYPDYVLLIVGANMGTVGMTQEHLNLSTSINLPTFVVITKVDICPLNVLNETKKSISKLIKESNRKAYLIRNKNDAITAAINFNIRICPVFLVSSVTGENIDVIKVFLNLLIKRSSSSSSKLPLILHIDDVYRVPGVGTVVGGIVKQGIIKTGQPYLLGPFGSDGKFLTITIKSIHRQRIPVDTGIAGQSISAALKNIKRSELRKGMVIVSKSINPVACYEFTARIYIYHTPATISDRYCAVLHISTVRQIAQIITKNKSLLTGGDEAVVTFKFIQRPEFVEVGSKLVFREGKMRGHGIVLSITPIDHTNIK